MLEPDNLDAALEQVKKNQGSQGEEGKWVNELANEW
jgi:hypothetical protein